MHRKSWRILVTVFVVLVGVFFASGLIPAIAKSNQNDSNRDERDNHDHNDNNHDRDDDEDDDEDKVCSRPTPTPTATPTPTPTPSSTPTPTPDSIPTTTPNPTSKPETGPGPNTSPLESTPTPKPVGKVLGITTKTITTPKVIAATAKRSPRTGSPLTETSVFSLGSGLIAFLWRRGRLF